MEAVGRSRRRSDRREAAAGQQPLGGSCSASTARPPPRDLAAAASHTLPHHTARHVAARHRPLTRCARRVGLDRSASGWPARPYITARRPSARYHVPALSSARVVCPPFGINRSAEPFGPARSPLPARRRWPARSINPEGGSSPATLAGPCASVRTMAPALVASVTLCWPPTNAGAFDYHRFRPPAPQVPPDCEYGLHRTATPSCRGRPRPTSHRGPRDGSTAPRHYELLLILEPGLDERTVAPRSTRSSTSSAGSGTVKASDVWGKRACPSRSGRTPKASTPSSTSLRVCDRHRARPSAEPEQRCCDQSPARTRTKGPEDGW